MIRRKVTSLFRKQKWRDFATKTNPQGTKIESTRSYAVWNSLADLPSADNVNLNQVDDLDTLVC